MLDARLAAGPDRPAAAAAPDRDGLDAPGARGNRPRRSALAAFYAERAAGGAALIVTGGSAVSRVGAGGRSYSFINEDADADKLARVAAAVHAAGGRVLLQLFHAGRYAFERSFGLQPVAPSAVYSSLQPLRAAGALRGGDRRDDRGLRPWRARAPRARLRRGRDHGLGGLPAEPVHGAVDEPPRRRVGRRRRAADAVPAGGRGGGPSGGRAGAGRRLPALGRRPGRRRGQRRGRARARARWPASGSVDALNVGIGWHEARVPTVQATVPQAAWTPWARAMREAVDGPGDRVQPDQHGRAGRRGDRGGRRRLRLDGAAVPGRPGVRRQEPRRTLGRVNVCIACNQCIDSSIFDRRVSCVVNPRAGFELELRRGARQRSRAARSPSSAAARPGWRRRGRWRAAGTR